MLNGYWQKYSLLLTKGQKRGVMLCFLLIFVCGFLEAFGVSLFVPLLIVILNLDYFYRFDAFNDVVSALGLQTQGQIVFALMMLMFIVIIIKNIIVYFSTIYRQRFVKESNFEMSSRLFHIYLHEHYESLLDRNSNELAMDITIIVSRAFDLLFSLLTLISEAVVAAALVIVMYAVDWQISLIFSVVFMAIVLTTRKVFYKRGRVLGKKSNECNTAALRSIKEAFAGIKEIQLMNREQYFHEEYRAQAGENVRLLIEKLYFQTAPRHIVEIAFFGVMAVVALGLLMGGGEMTLLVARLSAISVAAIRLIPSVNRINESLNSISFLSPSLDKITDEYLRYMKRETHEDGPVSAMRFEHQVELADIVYAYPNCSAQVLVGASLVIRKGQMIGLMGESGAGKTTLVDVLLGFLKPQAGRITCDGVDVSSNMRGWRANIGYIPQMIFIMDNSVRQNVLFGLPADDDEGVWRVLEKAQIADFIRGLPEGLDTRLGDRGIRLSGGQRQRIGIARALYSDPEILVFDEATSALDKETEAEVMRSVYTLGGEKTMIIIAHNSQTLQGCDCIYCVKDGRIASI